MGGTPPRRAIPLHTEAAIGTAAIGYLQYLPYAAVRLFFLILIAAAALSTMIASGPGPARAPRRNAHRCCRAGGTPKPLLLAPPTASDPRRWWY